MSVFKDVLKMNRSEESSVNENKGINLPEGISFLDANKSKVVVSVCNNSLLITKLIRNLDSYSIENIVLKKEHIPLLGELFLEFYNKGNFDKLKSKLELDGGDDVE